MSYFDTKKIITANQGFSHLQMQHQRDHLGRAPSRIKFYTRSKAGGRWRVEGEEEGACEGGVRGGKRW